MARRRMFVFANMRLMITETDENLQSKSLQMPRHRLKSWESEREDQKKKKSFTSPKLSWSERTKERDVELNQLKEREKKKIIKISREEAIKEDLKNKKYNKL